MQAAEMSFLINGIGKSYTYNGYLHVYVYYFRLNYVERQELWFLVEIKKDIYKTFYLLDPQYISL